MTAVDKLFQKRNLPVMQTQWSVASLPCAGKWCEMMWKSFNKLFQESHMAVMNP